MTPVIDTVAGARPVVELGVGDTRVPTGLARWDVSRWDDPDAEWAGTEPSWFDMTCFVHDIHVTVGRDRTMDRWEAGAAEITVDNRTGWADMGQGPPVEPLALSLRPGRQLRIGIALDDAAVQWMWRGFIDDAEPVYQPETHDVVTIAGIDAKGEAGKVDVAQVDPAVGVNESVATRIGRVLDLAGWPTGKRDIAPTAVTLIGTELGKQAGDLLDVAADSSGGAVFADTAGMVVFKPRDWQTYNPTDPPEATIGNGTSDDNDVMWHTDPVVFDGDQVVFGAASSADVCPSGWERVWRRADIATRVIVGRDGEPGRTFDDTPNQILYGIETLARTDLEAAQDSQLDTLGARWLNVMSADWMPRVAAVTIDAATSTAARDLAAGVDPTKPSRYRCRHLRGDGRVVFDDSFFATGVEHTISRDSWVCRIALDVAAPFAATGGRWDTAQWDQSLWTVPVADPSPMGTI